MSAVFELNRMRITTEQFHRMGEAGILSPDDRIELLNGEMIEMAPIGSRHAWTVDAIANSLRSLTAGIAWISTQNPVRLSSYDEPQPDVMVLRTKTEGYGDALPRSQDVLLLIEVSDTTANYDRGPKLALYANSGIRETWIVDLEERRLEMYREPTTGRYLVELERGPGDTVSPQNLPEIKLDLREILKP